VKTKDDKDMDNMILKRSHLRRVSGIQWIRLKAILSTTLLVTASLVIGSAALAADGDKNAWQRLISNPETGAKDFPDALIHGKPTLNFRARVEIADLDRIAGGDLGRSNAYTFRTRLGYGTKPWYGINLYADMENISAAKKDRYWNAVSNNTNSLTPIADPATVTELNQAYLKWDRPDWYNSKLIGGRQRIILDDSRFIGNVGWRQNEQTYDGVVVGSGFGVDDLETSYTYIGAVRRIFGNVDDRVPPNGSTKNWNSNSHLIHGSWGGFKYLKPTVFVYLLDLRNNKDTRPPDATPTHPAQQSSATYGLRLAGAYRFGEEEKWKLGYAGSYAYQTDFGDNPTSYGANYVKLDADIGHDSIGTLGLGWEMLGSDDGDEVFRTPLATLHKFNGWADVFVLNNGGPYGLRDLYVYVAPKLPWKLKTKLVYHYFTSDHGDFYYGNEFDGVISRPITKYMDLLFKAAYFKAKDGPPTSVPSLLPNVGSIYRTTVDFVIKF
jgi:hypothetical protein